MISAFDFGLFHLLLFFPLLRLCAVKGAGSSEVLALRTCQIRTQQPELNFMTHGSWPSRFERLPADEASNPAAGSAG